MTAAELVALLVFFAAAVALCLRWLHKITDPDLAIRKRTAMLDALRDLPAHPDTDWPLHIGERRSWR